MRFARTVFLAAAVYGVLVLAPGFFLEATFGRVAPPPLNHPEFYFGFYGMALAWQIVYWLISRDPTRYRPVMLIGVIAKGSFVGACLVLFLVGRLRLGGVLVGSLADAVMMALFLTAFLRTPSRAHERAIVFGH